MRISCFAFIVVASSLFCAVALAAGEVEAAHTGVVPDNNREDSLGQASEAAIKAIEEHLAKRGETKPAGVAQAPALVLDARKCVELALANNERVLVAEDEVAAVRAKIGQARAQGLPHVSGHAAETHTEMSTSSLGGGGISGAAASLVSSLLFSGKQSGLSGGDSTFHTFSATLTQLVFAGGQVRAAVKASEFLAKSQEWRRTVTLDTLEFEAKQAYYDCLLAQSLKRVADGSVLSFTRNLADTQQKLNMGLVSDFELLRSQTELASRQADAEAARNALLLALTNLRRVLALPQDTAIEMKAELDWVPSDTTVADLVKGARENRPELRALDLAIQSAEQDVRRVQGQYYPKVAANLDLTSTQGTGTLDSNGWSASIGAEWTLYTGGQRKHQKAESQAKVSSLRHQRQELLRVIELDVTRAQIQIEDAMARVHSQRSTVDLAREGLRMAQLRFQEGVGTQSETLDSDLALTKAETALVQSLREYAVANAALEKAIGKSWLR